MVSLGHKKKVPMGKQLGPRVLDPNNKKINALVVMKVQFYYRAKYRTGLFCH